MTEQANNYKLRGLPPNMAPLRNVAMLTALIERVQARTDSLPGMATFHGPSGYGKSTALVYATNKTGAIAVQVQSAWTRKTLCEAIVTEMGLPPEKTISAMVQQICRHLAEYETPLIIDEADYLLKTSMIELVRDIYEGSQAPVILIGEERMPQKLREWERVHNRMLDWVAAEPADAKDTEWLARIYAPGIDVHADLLSHIRNLSQGNTRRICVNLEKVREFAAERALDEVSKATWGERPIFTGTAPLPRYKTHAGGPA